MRIQILFDPPKGIGAAVHIVGVHVPQCYINLITILPNLVGVIHLKPIGSDAIDPDDIEIDAKTKEVILSPSDDLIPLFPLIVPRDGMYCTSLGINPFVVLEVEAINCQFDEELLL
jgi:hypothetical protein